MAELYYIRVLYDIISNIYNCVSLFENNLSIFVNISIYLYIFRYIYDFEC